MKILVVLPRFPYPLEKGDKLRAFHQIRCLSEHHDIYLFCLSHQSVTTEQQDRLRPYCRKIDVARLSTIGSGCKAVRNAFRDKSLQMGYWYSRRARHQLEALAAQVQPDVVYCQMLRTMDYVRNLRQPKVMDFQDALSLNIERRMLNHRGLRYFMLHYEFKMLRQAEYASYHRFNALTIISDVDRQAIPGKDNRHIVIVPNGVDMSYYHPMPSVSKQYEVVFCGNMQYVPNVDAVRFLIEEVMPVVWETMPTAHVLLAGTSPVASVRRLASNKVTVSGSVDDIRRCYASGQVFVAPMRLGSGLQNKLLEAMAMHVPCVTTPLANTALGATPGEEIQVGEGAVALAAHIVQLLQQDDLRQQQAQRAYHFVQEHYSWSSATQVLEQVLINATHHGSNVIDSNQ